MVSNMKRSLITTNEAFTFNQGEPKLVRRDETSEQVESFVDVFIQHSENLDVPTMYFYDVFVMRGLDRPTYVVSRVSRDIAEISQYITVIQVKDDVIIVGDKDKWFSDTLVPLEPYVRDALLGSE